MRVAIVSPYAVPPARNGATTRILRFASWLQSQGHQIHFVWAQIAAGGSPTVVESLHEAWGAATVLEHRGRPKTPTGDDWELDDWIDPAHETPFREAMTAFDPDIVLVNYIFLSRFLEWAPERAAGYLDTHDRLSRRAVYQEAGLTPGFFWTSVADELRGCARADVVLAIQDGEADHFAKSGRPVVTVGHHERTRFRPDPPQSGPLTIGYLAAYNKFNVVSFRRLLAELQRRRLLERSDVRFVLAGSLIRGCQQRAEIGNLPDGIENLGRVADLDDFYNQVDVVVNPTVVGTGLKIKSVEALARGKPLVSTAIGTDGLPERTQFHKAPGVPELVARLEEILRQPALLGGLSNASRHLHAEYQLNLEHNLDNLFSHRALAAHDAGTMASYVHHTMVSLHEADSHKSLTLDDPVLAMPTPTTIAHVVNPVPAGPTSDLYSAQPVALESMRRAKAFAATQHVDVDLVSCVADGDRDLRLSGFRATKAKAPLVTSVADFKHPRPLPLLRSILELGASETDAEWLIYTNADISVMPHFYTYIAERIRDGHDAIVINRRTIPRERMSVRDLNTMYSQLGEKHPGFDCFVFRRHQLPDYVLGDVAIGVHLVGRVLLWNLLAHAVNPLVVIDDHLTFHLGDDTSWSRPELLEYAEHNTAEAIDALAELDARGLTSTIQRHCWDDFDEKVFKLGFNPDALRDRNGARAAVLADRPVFVHALFRTGSTFMWHRMRRSRHLHAFYEPLHEVLARLRPDRLDQFRRQHTLGTRHDFKGAWLFKEYEDLLEQGMNGVRGYWETFAYEGFADNSPQPALRGYIDRLLASAEGRQAVLQFNRSALRQRWFHREYPQAHHLYLVRNPREQWASYLSFMRDGARGFNRNDAIIAGMNQGRALIRPLRQLVPLHRDTTQGNYFARYDQIFDGYSWEQRYATFYFIWLQGLLEAAWTGSRITDMNAVAVDPFEQMRLENYLRTRGTVVSLEGLTMTAHDDDTLPLSVAQLDEVERIVQAVIGRAHGLARARCLPASWRHLEEAMVAATTDPGLVVKPLPGSATVHDRPARLTCETWSQGDNVLRLDTQAAIDDASVENDV